MDRAELIDGSVCRLAKISASFPPGSIRPRADDFDLTSRDKAEAQAAGTEPLLSVFDEDRTTLEQAKAIYGRESIGFGLDVAEIRKIRIPESDATLRVLRDPLPPRKASLPGAKGHCGIGGLHRPPGARKVDYRRLRLQLRDLAAYRG